MPTTVQEMFESGQLPKNPLSNLKSVTRAHWREFRPRMYAALEARGALEQALSAAVALTKEQVLNDVARGVHLEEAFVNWRNEWCLLPDEETQPTLGTDPEMWQMPADDELVDEAPVAAELEPGAGDDDTEDAA